MPKKKSHADALFHKHLSDAVKEDPKVLPRYMQAALKDAEKHQDFTLLRDTMNHAIDVLTEKK